MKTIQLKIEYREEKGKSASNRTRSGKRLPGVVYGPHMEVPTAVSADLLEFAKVHRTASVTSILKLESENKDLNGKLALLKEVQVHPVSDARLHFDLYEVKEGEPFKLTTPIILEGKPKGVAEGGKLQQIIRSIDIKCLPKDIPSEIKIDVSDMGVNESLHISDVTLPNGVSVIGQFDITIASVVLPEKEDKKEDEEGVAAATDVAAPAAS